MLMYPSKKSVTQVQDLFKNLYGTTVPDDKTGKRSIIGVGNISNACIVHDRQSTVRYMCHLDNPKKAQYDPKDLIALNGADIMKLLTRTETEEDDMLKDILKFINDNNITEYCDLLDIIRNGELDCNSDWFHIVISRSHRQVIHDYVNSRRYKVAMDK